ncbi:unnamed protein product [Lactuca virosa]|uniref:Uncharacterized protein n=1 Tax=Lactuca virosa TaxID=75947 RepID=A0AAU9LTY8_9ASTR|nr:unnamed protein product [Lactuca virosa]
MDKERGNLLKSFGTQVAEPVRSMVMGAPLEDARRLAQRYDRMRQEAEVQAVEVSKRQARVKEGTWNPDILMKLDLKSNMAILGREAASAMAAVAEPIVVRISVHWNEFHCQPLEFILLISSSKSDRKQGQSMETERRR